MDDRLEIRVIMNSSIEEVLSFKCCNLHDQNMEIHLRNAGPAPLTLQPGCELAGEGDAGPFRIATLFPAGPYTLPAGETLACYCTLPEEIYARYRWIVFRDEAGREHRGELEPLR